MLTAVPCVVAVVAVDHGHAGATKRERWKVEIATRGAKVRRRTGWTASARSAALPLRPAAIFLMMLLPGS
jgi:hypothetical protein